MSAQSVRFGAREVGPGHPVYLVAEAGSNHNGQLEQAFRLIDAAVEARADAVKFQNFRAASLYPKSAGQADYLKNGRSIYQIVEAMEMPAEWVPRLAAYCRERGIDFMSSPFDEGSADLLAPQVQAFKVASYEMTHVPLLEHIARIGKPMILSTGTATLDEVLHAVDRVVAAGNDQIILLQCTASYPTPPAAVNLRAMVTLREATGRPVGLSDHSRDPVVAPVMATALGACLIEKHFTISNRLPGPDHQFAIEPHELVALVNGVRAAEAMLGHGRKEPLAEERELRSFARRSIFATRPIAAGERLTKDNVAVLRCGKLGYRLPPEAYPQVLGKRARRALASEALIALEDLE